MNEVKLATVYLIHSMIDDSPDKSVFSDNFTIEEEIGKGSFATVCTAIQKKSGKKVAVKIVSKSSLKTEQDQNRFVRETSMMKQIDHPFVTKLFDIIETNSDYYLVMEYVENGTLLDLLRNKEYLSEHLAKRYFAQIVAVLDYLHNERHICHRDLKAENIMLDNNNNIRLIDFGLSNFFTVQSPLLQTACGSPAYASPEMLKKNKYTKAADIWSAGVLLYTMVTGKLPFYDRDMQQMLRKILFSQPVFPDNISFQCQQLIRQMLMKSPQDRIKMADIKEHPWFEDTEYKQLLYFNFTQDKKFIVLGDNLKEEDIDNDIVVKLQELGFDTSQLLNALINDDYDEMTSIYRMMRREKIKEETNKFILSIEEKQNSTMTTMSMNPLSISMNPLRMNVHS